MQSTTNLSVNQITVTGVVKTLPVNFCKEPGKFWWSFPVVMTDRMADGQPVYQTLGITVFNKSVDDLVHNIKVGDEVLISGKLTVKTTKDQSGGWKTDVKLVSGINQIVRVLSVGNALPQPQSSYQKAPGAGYNAHRGNGTRAPAQQDYGRDMRDDEIPY